MQLCLLSEIPHVLDTIAQWYFHEWVKAFGAKSLDEVKQDLANYLNSDRMPLIVAATIDDEIVGAAQLKFYEMDIYPEYEHWLGGVYVADGHRGKGIAEKIIRRILEKAGDFGVETLYLQTENLTGGLYARMGWQPIEQVHSKGSDVVVMRKRL